VTKDALTGKATAASCPHCGLAVTVGARKCPHCLEWINKQKQSWREQLREFVTLIGGIIGLASTAIVAYNFFKDRVFPPKSDLMVLADVQCGASEVVVQIENRGRAAGYAPRRGTEAMSVDADLGVALRIASPVRVGPNDIVEVTYTAAEPGLQVSPAKDCLRTVRLGMLNPVTCSCQLESA
jgi:hypothetical protein